MQNNLAEKEEELEVVEAETKSKPEDVSRETSEGGRSRRARSESR